MRLGASQNFASIREQQIGGFTQVGAHGTGATLPTVDEQVGVNHVDMRSQNIVQLYSLR